MEPPFAIAPAAPGDLDAICAVVEAAFGRRDEAALVRRLVAGGDVVVSLAAREPSGAIAGHVLYSRLGAEGPQGTIPAVALAPLAVRPDLQSQGLGGALIAAGDAACAAAGMSLAVVLGAPAYYTRFGYRVEAAQSFISPFSGPHLMAKALAGTLPEGAVRLAYASAFA